MPLSVVVLFLICNGVASIGEGSTDAVSIAASGALLPGPAKAERSSKTLRRHSLDPDDDLPFVLDDRATPGTFRPLPSSASSATAFADSPFMLDDGTAPKAPPPGRSDSPFVVEGEFGPKAQTPAAAEVQTEAAKVNDSPFILDTDPSQAPSVGLVRNENRHAPTSDTPLPFVMDQQVGKGSYAETNEDDDRDDQAHLSRLSKQIGKKGPFTIVRNGQQATPSHTTQMVRNRHAVETTTVGPSTSSLMQFELGPSLLEAAATGKRFVPIPGTPFELDTHVVSPMKRQPKVRIELQRRSGSSQMPAAGYGGNVYMYNVPGPNGAMMNAAMYPAGVAPVITPANAFVQDSVQMNRMAPVAIQPPTLYQPGGIVVSANPPQAAAPDVAVASTPEVKGHMVAKSKTGVAEADVPLSTQNTLNAPVVLPAPQIGPDSPKDNSSAAKADNVSSTIGDAVASVGLNGTNSTLKAHGPAKVVTARGALIAIFFGFVVTIIFLSAVLCLLHAGRKPSEESPAREPPRPTRSYRQLLRAQQPETGQSSSATPPSV